MLINQQGLFGNNHVRAVGMHFKPASASRAGPSSWGGEGLAHPGFCGVHSAGVSRLSWLGSVLGSTGAGQAWDSWLTLLLRALGGPAGCPVMVAQPGGAGRLGLNRHPCSWCPG